MDSEERYSGLFTAGRHTGSCVAPSRAGYLRVYPVWEQVPGKNISYGDETLYHLHLRTR